MTRPKQRMANTFDYVDCFDIVGDGRVMDPPLRRPDSVDHFEEMLEMVLAGFRVKVNDHLHAYHFVDVSNMVSHSFFLEAYVH